MPAIGKTNSPANCRPKGFIRKSPKRVDFLQRYTRNFPLAVVEAKAAYKTIKARSASES
jgi:hypothetical protein